MKFVFVILSLLVIILPLVFYSSNSKDRNTKEIPQKQDKKEFIPSHDQKTITGPMVDIKVPEVKLKELDPVKESPKDLEYQQREYEDWLRQRGLNDYEILLQRDEWKQKRLQILERDGNKCCWCGYPHNLNVHHKYYLQYPNHKKVDPWDYPNDALITLCNKCHQKAHQKQIKVYYTRYKIRGFC